MKGKRPVGATHAGKRPKTAPQTFQERWKTEKVIELHCSSTVFIVFLIVQDTRMFAKEFSHKDIELYYVSLKI